VTPSGRNLQDFARKTARSLPDVSSGYPFTDKLLVFKVGEKVFLIITEDPADQVITVKIDPHHGDALSRDHKSITPGRYLDKHHWITIAAGEGISRDLVADLVAASYDLVVEGTPKAKRPDRAHNTKTVRGNDTRNT
jgi:predicted DNA-binding protein (MmcQ/YjbR family)